MSKHSDTEAALAFLNVLFGECDGALNLCTLRNNAGGAGAQITSGDTEALKKFIIKGDQRGWGTYVCVSTMLSTKHHHSKESINEIPALHIDIDLKDLALDNKEDVIKKLKGLRLPPSILVDSGNGIHAYWKFKEAIALGPNDIERIEDVYEIIERIESALKLLCDLVGGDQKVTQPSAVMRLPGTFNTKNENQNHLVTLWINDANGKAEMPVYELDDIEEWLSETSPIILRKIRPEGKTVEQTDENPYERIAREMGYKPPIDVEQRLDAMMYMGGGDTSIHQTQIQVSASLLEVGEDVENIVALLIDATRAAAGDYGKRWNWKREEKNIRKACEGWLKKQEKREDKTKSHAKPHTNGKDHGNGAAPHPQSTSGPASPGETKQSAKDKKRPFHITVAEAFFVNLELLGHDLRIFTDSKGNENLWKYEEGLWSIVMNISAWLDGQIEEVIRGLKSTHKSTNRICAETRMYILRSPNVRKMQRNPFDQHGKTPVKGMLIDPFTLKAEPIKKEHYCTWTMDIPYDPKAKCKWWLQMLNDTFSDRTTEEKKERIDLLQDFMGAALVDNKNKALRRAMVIIGDSNSGKSSLLDVMSGMMTDDPITTPIVDLTSNHGMQSFIRRAPWILHEAFDQSEWNISSKAKLILGGDVFEVNPKGKNAISTSFTAPAIFATNHPPKFRESTKAMINRMILLRTTFVFEDEEIGAAKEARKHGYQEPQEFVLATEKSGILNWMLIGAQRAMQRGFYINTEEGKEALHDIRLDSNIVAGFVEDCIDFNPDIRISTPNFNAAFISWWKEHRGDERHMPSPDFIGRSLKALSHTQIAMDRHKFKDRDGLRFICGVELNEAGQAHWENTADVVNGPGNQAKGDLARISSTIAGVRSAIPMSWDNHPQIVRIRANAAHQKTKPKF